MSKEDKSEWTPLEIKEPYYVLKFEGSESFFNKKDLSKVAKRIQAWLVKQAEGHHCYGCHMCCYGRTHDAEWCTSHPDGTGEELQRNPFKYWKLRERRNDQMPKIAINRVVLRERIEYDDFPSVGFFCEEENVWYFESCSDEELAKFLETGEIVVKD